MSKILFICLSSYQPKNSDFRARYNRQELYAVALWNLIKETKAQVDICVVENTVEQELAIENDKLKSILDDSNVTYKFFINNNALGTINKGAGEFTMCKAVIENLGDNIKKYDWIVYYTSRHILYRLQDLTQLLNTSNSDILISNSSYILPDGSTIKSAPVNYNDMIFAMKPDLFVAYCTSMNPEKLVEKRMNSETQLFNFVEEVKNKGKKVETLDDIWLCRYDYVMKHMHLNSNNPASYADFEKVRNIYIDFYTTFSTQKNDTKMDEKSLEIKMLGRKPNFLEKIIFNSKIYILDREYFYDIEAVWLLIETRLKKQMVSNIIFPEDKSTFIYQNRLNTLSK